MSTSPRPRPVPDSEPPEEGRPPQRHASSEYDDAGHPGGLPDLDKKTETEDEHDA